MNRRLLEKLSPITEEEREILNGKTTVDRRLYYSSDKKSEIDSNVVLSDGKLIDIRPHTRFIHFPKHSHNYVEFIYMVKGTTRHIIDEEEIVLHEGDLLFLNQHASQEIYPAKEEDIAVNFMILPQFFSESFVFLGEGENALKSFIVSCLTSKENASNYLYIRASGHLPITNLLENLIWNLLEDEPNKRSINQHTMGLLFLNLLNHSEEIRVSRGSYEENIALQALSYIDTHYDSATLYSFAEKHKIDDYTASRIIKRQTGKTFKELLEKRRMEQASFLLKNTNTSAEEVGHLIGYENISFFYKLFKRTYQMTPKQYRREYE